MKHFLLGLLGAAVVALPAYAGSGVGDKAPMFEARASLAGKPFNFSLHDALKKGPVVVYFYPSAYTQGCDIEAHTFSEMMGKFKAAGATVIGVSLDSIQRLNDFSADPKYCAGKLPVASDSSGTIAKSFDVTVHPGRAGIPDVRGVEIGHGFADRTTFVLKPDGTIAAVFAGIAPAEHVHKALAAVEALKHGA